MTGVGRSFGLSMKDIRQAKKGSPSKLQERKNRLGLGKLSCSSSIASAKSSVSNSAVSFFSSNSQIEEIILAENKERCDFFKFFKFDESTNIGKGCSSTVFKCQRVVAEEDLVIDLQAS